MSHVAELRDLAGNLRLGLRLVALRPLDPGAVRVSAHQLAALAVVGLALSLAGGWLGQAGRPLFDSSGWGDWALDLVLLLGTLYLVAVPARLVGALGRAAVLLLSAVVLVDAVSLTVSALLARTALGESVAWAWVLGAGQLLWAAVVALRVFLLLVPGPPGRGAAAGLAWLALYLGLGQLLPAASFWHSGWAGDDDWRRYRELNVEDVYYAQRPLMQAGMRELRPHRPGVTDLYFLGFASYAMQDVFLKEVGFVQDLFDRRFDTAGRSLKLVNSLETLERVPLANANNLRLALAALRERMDVEEDVLFLYLTSHGSEDHRLSVDFWPLRLNDIPAPLLRRLLDESGIRYRVVVVSACYSGGFVDEVATDDSLVITAARRDRQSFGCANDRDFTYFGEAYFGEALELERSFLAAAALARESIRARETAEGLTPSEPQIHVGPGIVPVLERLQARLEPGGGPARAEVVRAD